MYETHNPELPCPGSKPLLLHRCCLWLHLRAYAWSHQSSRKIGKHYLICPYLSPRCPKNTFLIQHNHRLQKSNQSCLHFYNSLLSLSSSDTLFWVKHLGSLGDTLRQVGSHQVQLKKHHSRPGGHRRGSPALECFGATVGGRRQPGKTGKMEMVAKRPIHWWSGHETSALCWHNLYWKQFMVQDWLNNKSLPAKQRHIQRSFSTANIC